MENLNHRLIGSSAHRLIGSSCIKSGIVLLFLIMFPKIAPFLNAQTDLDYSEQGFPSNYDTTYWSNSSFNSSFGDTCKIAVNIVSSVVRFDQESIVELNFGNGYQPTNLTMTLSSGVGSTIYPDSIYGNRVIFDNLDNDEFYTIKGNDFCAANVEIEKVSTSAVGSKEDVVLVSEVMMGALRNFHKQDTANAVDLVEFLVSYQGLSKLETLSYLQNILRDGTPTDRDFYDGTDSIIFSSFSLLTDDDIDPDPDPDPDPWEFDESYCTCRIAQTNIHTTSPGKVIDEERKIIPESFAIENGQGGWFPFYYTVYEKGYQALGPARMSRNFRRGIYQAERINEVLSNMDTSQVTNNPAYYAVLDYTLNCITNPFGKPGGTDGGINVCDCVRQGSLDWSYDALLRIDNGTFPAPFWDSYASGYLQEMAYVLKIEGDEEFEVLDVGMTELASSCSATVDRDFLVDLLMIQTSMGLSVLNNLTLGSDSTEASIDWANAAGEIAEQISDLISQDSVLINTCDTTGTIIRRLLDSATADDEKTEFVLRMGKPMRIVLASGFHSSISTKGTSGIELVTNTAFRLGGVISGGVPKDFFYRDDPRPLETCCGQYVGNYVLGNIIPPEQAELSVVRSEEALRGEFGVFFAPGFWQDSDGNLIEHIQGVGTDLPETNYGLLLSQDNSVINCVDSLMITIRSKANNDSNSEDLELNKSTSFQQILEQLEGHKDLKVSLFSISGKLLNRFSFSTYAEALFYLENLPPGLYIMNLQADKKFYNYKIMKP